MPAFVGTIQGNQLIIKGAGIEAADVERVDTGSEIVHGLHHGPAMARPPRSDMTTVGSVSVPLREDPAGVLRVGAT